MEAQVLIGATLADARQQAGLSVAQVSERTRIRETIIRGIEDDDYSACGGDFYARGNIRSIAKVVGADSEPLIREYDALYRAPDAVSAVSLDELLASSARTTQRRRPDQPVTWGLTPPAAAPPRHKANLPTIRGLTSAAAASVRRTVNLPAARERTAAAAASAQRRVNRPAVRERAARAYPAAGRRPNWTVVLALALGLALVMVLGLGVYRLVSGSPHTAAPPAAGKHAAAHHHSAPVPAPAASHAATQPSSAPAPAPAAQALHPVGATAFGPGGGDNPQRAHLAIDGSRATAWRTDWYTSARFGNLYPGTGLLLDMGRTVTITSVKINLGRVSGAGFQLRAGARSSLGGLHVVAHASDAGGVVRLRLSRPAHGRYVLVWFTRLPASPAGSFQASVYNVSLRGQP